MTGRVASVTARVKATRTARLNALTQRPRLKRRCRAERTGRNFNNLPLNKQSLRSIPTARRPRGNILIDSTCKPPSPLTRYSLLTIAPAMTSHL